MCLVLCILCIEFYVAAQDQIHIVQKGETLYSISKSYGVSLDELCSINGIKNSSMVKVGQKLIVPSQNVSGGRIEKPGTYTVEKGDTLYSLARTFGITVDISIKQVNISCRRLK